MRLSSSMPFTPLRKEITSVSEMKSKQHTRPVLGFISKNRRNRYGSLIELPKPASASNWMKIEGKLSKSHVLESSWLNYILPAHVVAVSDTYRDEISDGYPIRDRIYYGWHHILGWHTYPGMVHLPGNFNVGTLTQSNEIASTCTTRGIPGPTVHSLDHVRNSWAYCQQSHNHHMQFGLCTQICSDMA